MAALASAALSCPLILKGTPDVESYMLSIFSTMAFAQDLMGDGDPWFIRAYGFGVPLPTSTWLIQFPLAVPAALAGVDWLYAVLWVVGEFLFAFYFLRLAMAFTRHRAIALVLLVTALLSFSNLGTTYVDDWPEHFLGWALLPACVWYVGRTLLADTPRQRLTCGAACAFVLGIFTGATHHNEMAAFFSGLAVMLAVLLPTRPRGVLAVCVAVVVAIASSVDVLLPTAVGMLAGNANPVGGSIAAVRDDPTLQSYGSFLEPLRALVAGGMPAVRESTYDRVPFFGLAALALAIAGAVRAWRSRAPFGAVPNDFARSIAVGFVVFSALTLMPPWVVLNLPRMWAYRDGQTLLALLCAGMALDAMWHRSRRLIRPVLALHLAQMGLVAAPIVHDVVSRDNDGRLFGYARREHVLFDRLRQAGVGADSRLVLAGELEELLRGSLPEVGVTAITDFALEGIPLVNAWYRGGMTPTLGEASMDGRYGAYETIISWKTNLLYLDRAGLDVLGITHVAVLEQDLPSLSFAGDLVTAGTFELPGGRRVHVLRNSDAWSRAVLLDGPVATLPARPSCPSPTVYCRDYTALVTQLDTPLAADWRGSTMRAMLPSDHDGGTVLVSVAAGLWPVARVDGEQRPVERMLSAFATVEVNPGERAVELSVRPPRMILTVLGMALLLGSLVMAILPLREPAREPAAVR